jgi:hypothetical protein
LHLVKPSAATYHNQSYQPQIDANKREHRIGVHSRELAVEKIVAIVIVFPEKYNNNLMLA